MSTKQPILVVLAHPDDETFICGGTLAKYAQAGHPVTLVCATAGEMGRRLGIPPTATRATLPHLRRQELEAACAALGIHDLRLLGLLDKTLDYYDPQELVDRILPVFAQIRPAAVITFHEAIGGHPDHCAIGRAATRAWAQFGQTGRLYHLLWRRHDEQLAKVGAAKSQVSTIKLPQAAVAAKVAAYRAHRTQSGLHEWLWGTDKAARAKLSGSEHLLQGSGAPRSGESDILTGA